MPYPISVFTSEDAGAPTLNQTAGSLIGVLDACLVNGFNSKSVTSIVVADGVATVTVSAHGYTTGRITLISGATPAGLNGRQKVTVTGANTFTFSAAGIADQTATGTITVKQAPLEWIKEFSGTNKAVYKRSSVAATAMKLRIDDTATGVASATQARVLMVESASGVDTYAAESPTAAQLSGGIYWDKGVASAAAKPWIIIGDDLAFYLFVDKTNSPFANTGALAPCGFGDLVSYRAGDTFHTFIAGGQVNANYMFELVGVGSAPSNSNGGIFIARANNQIGGATVMKGLGYAFSSMLPGQLSSNYWPVYPSPVDNGMVITRSPMLREDVSSANYPIRGEYPGVAYPLAAVGNTLHKQVLNGIAGFSGDYMAVAIANASLVGCVLVDITGPWR